MKSILLVACLAFFCPPGFAQDHLEIGIEGGLTADRYRLVSPTNLLEITPGPAPVGGLVARFQRKRWFGELAFQYKGYQFGHRFKGDEYLAYGEDNQTFILPVRLGYRQPLCGSLALTGRIGLAPVFVFESVDGSREYLDYPLGPGERGLEYEVTTIRRFSCLATAGAGIEWRMFRILRVGLHADYFAGLQKINRYDLRYTTDGDANWKPGLIESRGSMLAWQLSLRYALRKPVR